MVATKELNKLFQLRTKIKLILCDLHFLQKCKRFRVFPKFLKFKVPRNMDSHFKAECMFKFKQIWLNKCIQSSYAKLAEVETSAYNLHLSIIKNHSSVVEFDWDLWFNNSNSSIEKKMKEKMRTQNQKLKRLRQNQKTTVPEKVPQYVEGYVKNLSSVTLSEEEESFLNKGLNFAIPNKTMPTFEIIADLEHAISSLPEEDRDAARRASKKILLDSKTTDTRKSYRTVKTYKPYTRMIQSLTNKGLVYSKADKGNAVVVMDREYYTTRIDELISEGNYVEVNKNPLPAMDRKADSIRLEISKLFDNNPDKQLFLQRKLKVSNPQVPRLYVLPKIHKEGNKVRQIVSNIDSPFEKIAKWLVDEFSSLPKFESLEIKNSFELTELCKDVKLDDNEILVSFDVTALFPSVPIDKAISIIENWLRSNNIEEPKLNLYIRATRLCMQESYFQVNEKFYKQTNGTSMGNPLSPFIANIFMSHFETTLKRKGFFPRFWVRYVDDILAIIKKHELRRFLKLLNSQDDSIKFTHEEESNGKLPFLDLELSRNEDNTLSFDIFRKSTTTDRFITSESYHSRQHKISSFRSMVHRLVNIPLSESNFRKEESKIKEIASINGFGQEVVNNLIRKAKKKKRMSEISTLTPVNENSSKWFKISFHPGTSERLVKLFRKYNINLVECSNTKISRFLTNNKDKKSQLEKSGVYEIQCGDCEKKYIGSSKRQIQVRFREHINPKKIDESSVAEHIFETGHNITKDNLRLLHTITDDRKLGYIEAQYINREDGILLQNKKQAFVSLLTKLKFPN